MYEAQGFNAVLPQGKRLRQHGRKIKLFSVKGRFEGWSTDKLNEHWLRKQTTQHTLGIDRYSQ